MKILLGLLISLCVFALAQEETDSFDRLACLDESQRSHPISDTAVCVDGELFDPYERVDAVSQPPMLPDWGASDEVLVEVTGANLSNQGDVVSTVTVDIPEPTNVQALYVQVVFRHGGAFVAPDDVTVSSTTESKSVRSGGLRLSLPSDRNGVTLGNLAHFYEGIFAPADSLTVNIDGIGDIDSRTPRAFIIYIVRPTPEDSFSVGTVPNYYLYGAQGYETASQTITIPASDKSQDVNVTFVVNKFAGTRNLGDVIPYHVANFTITAGGLTQREGIPFSRHYDNLTVYRMPTLEGVPAGTTQLTATVTSAPILAGVNPYDFENSLFWNGLSVRVREGDDIREADDSGEYDPFAGFNFVPYDPTLPSDAVGAAMLQNYKEAYDALTPQQQRLVDEGKWHFNGIDGFHIAISPRTSTDVDTPAESEK